MALWEWLTTRIDQESERHIYLRVDPLHVDLYHDGAQAPLAAQAGEHYFRLRLAQMSLQKDRTWGKSWYPAVHSLVRLSFGGKTQEIPNVADAGRAGLKAEREGTFVGGNFPLTTTLPFNDGVIELEAGLYAMEGENYLNTVIGVLSSFSSLLAVPQVSSALALAQPLASGIQNLFGGQDGHVHLSLHDSFGAGQLTAGYMVAINATEGELRNVRDQLWVIDNQLRIGTGLASGAHRAFDAYDYMLFWIEVFDRREDWRDFTSINEPFGRALNDLKTDNLPSARIHRNESMINASQAPDLTIADRRRVPDQILAEYEAMKTKLGSGLTDTQSPDLQTAMDRSSMSATAALLLGPRSPQEIDGLP